MPIPNNFKPPSPLPSSDHLAWKLAAAGLCRMLFYTAKRLPYPFAMVLSRNLGVPLTAVTTIMAANHITALAGLLFGPLTDRIGSRIMMLAGLGLMTGGMLAAGISPGYTVMFGAFFLAGLGKALYDPALQSWVGQRVPFHRRGFAVGLLETTWALSALIGIPLMGLAMEHLSWRSPFFILGGLSVLGIIGLRLLIRPTPGSEAGPVPSKRPAGIFKGFLLDRRPLGILATLFLITTANDNLFVIFGAWLEQEFDLTIAQLGLSTMVIGLADLSGSSLTAILGDRLGLKRAAGIGLAISFLAYGALPLACRSLPLTAVNLFVLFCGVEFSIVTLLCLSTEIMPEARATMMAGAYCATGLGRFFGALLGGRIWLLMGLAPTALTSAGITVIAACILFWTLRTWSEQQLRPYS